MTPTATRKAAMTQPADAYLRRRVLRLPLSANELDDDQLPAGVSLTAYYVDVARAQRTYLVTHPTLEPVAIGAVATDITLDEVLLLPAAP